VLHWRSSLFPLSVKNFQELKDRIRQALESADTHLTQSMGRDHVSFGCGQVTHGANNEHLQTVKIFLVTLYKKVMLVLVSRLIYEQIFKVLILLKNPVFVVSLKHFPELPTHISVPGVSMFKP
jgi:hypothetical protein